MTVCLAVISGGLATGEVIAVNYNSSDNTATDERAPDNSTSELLILCVVTYTVLKGAVLYTHQYV